jgi:hypothetical protein
MLTEERHPTTGDNQGQVPPVNTSEAPQGIQAKISGVRCDVDSDLTSDRNNGRGQNQGTSVGPEDGGKNVSNSSTTETSINGENGYATSTPVQNGYATSTPVQNGYATSTLAQSCSNHSACAAVSVGNIVNLAGNVNSYSASVCSPICISPGNLLCGTPGEGGLGLFLA